MDYTIDVIDACRTIARQLSNDVLVKIPRAPDVNYTHSKHGHKHHYHEEHPNKFQVMSDLGHYDLLDNGIRCYCGSQQAYIDFTGLRMIKIRDETFDPPVKFNEQRTPVSLVTWTNNGGERQSHIFRKSKETTIIERYTSSFELGQEIAYSLKTKVGGSIEIGSAEVESTYSFKANFSEKFESEKTTEDKQVDEQHDTYIVEPYTETTLEQEKIISDYHQTVHTTGVLDAEIFVCSEYPDFNPGRRDWSFKCDSLEELQEYMRGGGADLHWFTDDFFKKRQFQTYVIDTKPFDMTVVDNFTFRDVQSSKITQNDRNLKAA